MEFMTRKPPVVQNSQRTYKRSLNLHFAIIVVALASIVLKALVKDEYVANSVIKVIVMLVVGAGFSVLVEVLYSYFEGTLDKYKRYKGFVDPITTGLLIALLLPTVTPIYVLLLAIFVGVYAGKLVYGGYGFYIFNPALVGVLFAKLSFSDALKAPAVAPLVQFKAAMTGGSANFENLTELLVGNYEAVAIGSTSAILLAIVFIYLLVTKVIDIRISGIFLLTVIIISGIIGFITGWGLAFVILNLMLGLTLFAATFLISEPVSSPTSRETKMIYAVIVGTVMMLVRVLGSNTEGLFFAVLLGNMLTPWLNRTVTRSTKQTLIKTAIILFVVVVISGFIIGFILQGNLMDGGAI